MTRPNYCQKKYLLEWPNWLIDLDNAIFNGLPANLRANWTTNLTSLFYKKVDLQAASSAIQARILKEIVLPIAGGSTEAVKKVINGIKTNWVADQGDRRWAIQDCRKAQWKEQVTATESHAADAAALVAHVNEDLAAEVVNLAVRSVVARAKAHAGMATATFAEGDIMTVKVAVLKAGDTARAKTWVTISKIVLEELNSSRKHTVQ
jgi:hypothetical protein